MDELTKAAYLCDLLLIRKDYEAARRERRLNTAQGTVQRQDGSRIGQGSLPVAEARLYIQNVKAWIARQDERGFGPREECGVSQDGKFHEVGFGLLRPPLGKRPAWLDEQPATHSPEAGETIARAIRWHR